MIEAVEALDSRQYAHTTQVLVRAALRRILMQLWEHHGAPKLDAEVPRLTAARPRNVTATQEEHENILGAASPSLRLFLLLCSDLALRSGTAVRISGHHYDSHSRTIRFTSKGNTPQVLPVTEEIAHMIAPLDHATLVPYVWQIRMREHPDKHHIDHLKPTRAEATAFRRELTAVRLKLGITRRIVPHDLRRTTAVAALRLTQDLRVVKALLGHKDLKTTLWYLDHDTETVTHETLEALKRPYLVKPTERTA